MARKRRPAEETRAEILEVAGRHLLENGPAGVRLDQIAAEIGFSRQTILHHFGNREGMMRALVEEAWTGLFRDLASLGEGDPSEFVERVDDVARRRGNARIGAWLLLSGQGLPDAVFEGALAALPDSILPNVPDAKERVLLLGAAVFGDALFGGRFRQVLGVDDSEDGRASWHRWLSEQVLQPPER